MTGGEGKLQKKNEAFSGKRNLSKHLLFCRSKCGSNTLYQFFQHQIHKSKIPLFPISTGEENSKNTALKCLWILGDQMMHFLLQTSVIIADFPFLSLLAAADATVPLLDYKHRKAFLGSHDFQEEERFNMTFFLLLPLWCIAVVFLLQLLE